MRDEDRGDGAGDGRFEDFGEVAASPEPGKRGFDDRAAEQDVEVLRYRAPRIAYLFHELARAKSLGVYQASFCYGGEKT